MINVPMMMRLTNDDNNEDIDHVDYMDKLSGPLNFFPFFSFSLLFIFSKRNQTICETNKLIEATINESDLNYLLYIMLQ